MSMEGRGSCGLSVKLGEKLGSCPCPGLGEKDSRRKRPGASPLGCSSSLFHLEAEVLGEPQNRPREGGGKKSMPQGLPAESPRALAPSSGGASSLLSVYQKQFGVPMREDKRF